MGFNAPVFLFGIGPEPSTDAPPIDERLSAPFKAEERSPHQSPAYCYVIKHPDGTFQYFTALDRIVRVTNLPEQFVVDEPQIFLPTQIRHGIIAAQNKFEPRHVNLTFPSNDERIRRFFVTAAPVKVSGWILRLNGDAIIADEPVDFALNGTILESGVFGQYAFEGPAIMAELTPEVFLQGGGIPRFYSSRRCNHPLYSRGCGLNKADFAFEAEILTLNPAQREMIIEGQRAASPANFFSAGHVNSATLGIDFSVAWSEWSAADTKLKLTTWHPELAVGQTVTAYGGCLHTVADCTRLDNVANFGGFAHVPKKNPATNGT